MVGPVPREDGSAGFLTAASSTTDQANQWFVLPDYLRRLSMIRTIVHPIRRYAAVTTILAVRRDLGLPRMTISTS